MPDQEVDKNQWKVVKIIDSTRLVVSTYGLGSVLRRGDALEIYEVGPTIRDQEGIDLGPLHIVKGRVTVDIVEPRFVLCLVPTRLMDITDLMKSERPVFRVDESGMSGGWKYGPDLVIRIGDLARRPTG